MKKSEKDIITNKIKDEAYQLEEIYQTAINEEDPNQYGIACDEAFKILRIITDLMEEM